MLKVCIFNPIAVHWKNALGVMEFGNIQNQSDRGSHDGIFSSFQPGSQLACKVKPEGKGMETKSGAVETKEKVRDFVGKPKFTISP